MLSLRLSPCHYFSAVVCHFEFSHDCIVIYSSTSSFFAETLLYVVALCCHFFPRTFVVLPSYMHAFVHCYLHSYFSLLCRFSHFFFLAINDFYAFCQDCLPCIIALSPGPCPFVPLPGDNYRYLPTSHEYLNSSMSAWYCARRRHLQILTPMQNVAR